MTRSEVFSGHIGPSKLKRVEGDPRKERIAGATGFMIFRKGMKPQAEDRDEAGVKHTAKRFRSDRNSVRCESLPPSDLGIGIQFDVVFTVEASASPAVEKAALFPPLL